MLVINPFNPHAIPDNEERIIFQLLPRVIAPSLIDGKEMDHQPN